MYAEERHQAILEQVRARGSVRVVDVAAELAVSPVTIRKDIELLAKRGLVTRVHGGAMLPPQTSQTPQVNTTLAHPEGSPSPGPAAQAVTLGMIVPMSGYYYHAVIKGAQDAAAAHGAQLIIRIGEYKPATECTYVQGLIDTGVDGILLTPTEDDTGSGALPWYTRLDVPVVLVERSAHDEVTEIEHVVSDHAHGAQLAVRHLADRNRRRIALLMRGHTPTAPLIDAGYRAALDALGLERPTRAPFVDLADHQPGEPAFEALMTAFIDQVAAGTIDAVIVHPDGEALPVLQAMRTRGLVIPDRLALVTYDDELASLAEISITAVAPPKHAIGYTAAELLISRIQNPARPRQRISILPELHVRDS